MRLFYTSSSKVEKEEIFLFLKHKGIKLPTAYRNKTSKSHISKTSSKLAEKWISLSNLLISKAEITSCTSVQPEDWARRALVRRQHEERLGYIPCSLCFSFSLALSFSLSFGFLFLQGLFPQLLGTRAAPGGKPWGISRAQGSTSHLLPSGPIIWVALWSCSFRQLSQAK